MCEYQDPTNYTLSIVDENGRVVDSTGSRVAPMDGIIMENFSIGINANQRYSAMLLIRNYHLTNITGIDIGKHVVSQEYRSPKLSFSI